MNNDQKNNAVAIAAFVFTGLVILIAISAFIFVI
jgi:heme/copper-type cytochrome/quinol oxidase subunit 4